MILNLTIQNFRSFKDLNTLSLEPISKGSSPALPFVAVYGPNASGKSNIVKALAFIQFAVQNENAINLGTVKHPLLQPFMLNQKNPQNPSMFEITVLHKAMNATYRYGFEVHKNQVISEWLIESALRSNRVTEREIYVRKNDTYKFDSSINISTRSIYTTVPRSILALPRFANNNMSQALALVDLIANQMILFDCTKTSTIFDQATRRLTEDAELRAKVSEVVKDLDVSVQRIDVKRHAMSQDDLSNFPVPEELKSILAASTPGAVQTNFSTVHNVYDEKGTVVDTTNFDYHNNESLGTQNLILFITMLIDSMNKGYILVADEFGSGFHPFITAAIIKLFTAKKHSAQFIALTHETYPLSQEGLISKDMIWFVEKNVKEESSLVSLSEYKTRSDARLEKQYLEGRFGAVPIVLKSEI
jgi:AAA15 family ATPase/GTPase